MRPCAAKLPGGSPVIHADAGAAGPGGPAQRGRDRPRRRRQHRHAAAHHGDRRPGDGYYVTSFTYRLIRPLAFAELIERQITYVDFSVDPQVVDLLRVKSATKAMLCDAEVIFNDPDADWTRQREHFFSGNIGALARSGLANEPNGTVRVLREEEFATVIDEREMSVLAHQMLASLDLAGTPRLWARLMG